jgi:hypothetical protein
VEFPAWWSAQLSKLTDAYAGNAGAFAGLARGSRLLYEPDGRVLLDQHLPGRVAATAPAAVSDPAHAAVIHRAIGWLIGQGLPPVDAVGEAPPPGHGNRPQPDRRSPTPVGRKPRAHTGSGALIRVLGHVVA